MKAMSSDVSWIVGTRFTTADTRSLQDLNILRSHVCTSDGMGIGGVNGGSSLGYTTPTAPDRQSAGQRNSVADAALAFRTFRVSG
jgi:hypothetical protein